MEFLRISMRFQSTMACTVVVKAKSVRHPVNWVAATVLLHCIPALEAVIALPELLSGSFSVISFATPLSRVEK
jgi:hypothetical protein